MTTKANMKFLKTALTQLEFAQGDLEDFVYYIDSDTASNISSEILQQITYLKNLIDDLEFHHET
mgnify:FL=1